MQPPRFLSSIFAWGGLSLAALHAAPVERDLGRGLAYFRLHELPADLPGKPAAGRVPACVVDVRFLRADEPAATAFAAWVRFRATRSSPVFVVANGETEGALLKALTTQGRIAGVVLVGIESRGFRPDVAVNASAQNERRAYDAFEKGAAIERLLTENPDKVRNDEASLSKDRLAEAAADAADDLLAGKRSAPPLDAALQRAVHLHRALVALKKI